MDQIYTLAARRGLNKSQLAAAAGIDPSVMARSYRREAISLDNLASLASVVGLSIALTEAQSELARQLDEGSLF
ncbi:helix-turn-helix domain-containing protein [Chitinilyticum aquatile]|uniref:helix-turn-helix domain-containing protein n=1 Tax=Chitinilyticum aquatile TaxID=362520 RepID=UPI000411DBF4|nr:helix-turn-helix transcriptional regulator [Chitinilyticum aquatile]